MADSFCKRDWEKDRLDYLGLIDLPQSEEYRRDRLLLTVTP